MKVTRDTFNALCIFLYIWEQDYFYYTGTFLSLYLQAVYQAYTTIKIFDEAKLYTLDL